MHVSNKRVSGWSVAEITAEGRHRIEFPDALADGLQRELAKASFPTSAKALPTLALCEPSLLDPLVMAVREALLEGPGLAILSSSVLATWTDRELEALHALLCTKLGRPMWQNSARDMVVRVEDVRPTDPERARGFISNTSMRLHTDGWDCAGLMCLSQAETGGASLFASSEAVHAAIEAEAPDLLALYFEHWEWDVRVLTDDPKREPVLAPIFSLCEGRLSCRYGSFMLRNGPQAAGRELAPERVYALDLFEAVASRESLVLRHRLRRGVSVWMENGRILHGREAFRDAEDAGTRRRLIRLWATIDGALPRAADFIAFDTVTFGQSPTTAR
jgi:hypothetical protein